jgi:sugar (pentulose or hexulose) kinase
MLPEQEFTIWLLGTTIPDLLRSSQLESSYFPDILPSTEILGELTSETAHLLGVTAFRSGGRRRSGQ